MRCSLVRRMTLFYSSSTLLLLQPRCPTYQCSIRPLCQMLLRQLSLIIEVGFVGDSSLDDDSVIILAFLTGCLLPLLLLLEGGINRLCGVIFWRPVPRLCRRPTPVARGIVSFSFLITKKCAICHEFWALQPFGQIMARSYGTNFSISSNS